ncbi:MAG: OmpA family protein [Acidiphilium sp.]|nr:OmpA family protein [Acidiphilium sp.]
MTQKSGRWAAGPILLVPALTSCSPSSMGPAPVSQGPSLTLTTQNATIDLEASDRINRFRRLSNVAGIRPPKIQMLYAPAGSVPGVRKRVPVVLVTFDEGVFFNTNRATPIASSAAVLNVIARNMADDVPDAALTILGNTDSTGTSAYNDNLSKRRALHVMKSLSARGVDPLQMTTVAIGDRQPVASNATAAGRAMNRRVEFLISASPQANLAVIQYRHVDLNYLTTNGAAPIAVQSSTVSVLQPHTVIMHGVKKLALMPVGPMQIEPATPSDDNTITERPLAPAPLVSERELAPVAPSALNKNILVD